MSSERIQRQRDLERKQREALALTTGRALDIVELKKIAEEEKFRAKPKPKPSVVTPTQEAVDAAKANLEAAAKLDKAEARARVAVKPSKPKPILPSQRDVKTIVDVANELYLEAGFVKKTRLDQAPPKATVEQLKARLGLFLLEPIIGGVQEATFGAIGPQDRPATAVLRVAGALATPTLADLAVGAVLQKLTITPRARTLLKKIESFITEKLDPLDTIKVVKTLGRADEIALTDIHKTAIIKPRLLSVDDADELAQFLKLDKIPSAVEFEEIITTLRRGDLAPPLPLATDGSIIKKSFKNQIDELIDSLTKAFKKSTSLDDPVQAAKAWEEGLTTARRLTQRKIGPSKLPLLEIDFPGLDFEAGLTSDRRNAVKLFDLRNSLNQGSISSGSRKNFIELILEGGKTRRGFTVLAPPDLSKVANAADDLINFIDDNPTLFQDGALFSWMISGLNDKDAKKVIKETTGLPSDKIDDIVEQRREIISILPEIDKPSPPIFVPTLDEDVIPSPEPPIEETISDVDMDQEPKPKPPIQVQEPVLDEPVLEEPIIEEPLPDETLLIRLSAKEKEEREGLETRIMAGPKQKWRVTFDGKDPWIGDARGVVGALSKAQKGRRDKKQPDLIIVQLVKIK